MPARTHHKTRRGTAGAAPSTPAERASRALREVLARNLVAARIALDMTQQELAVRANLSRVTINHIETAHADVRLDTLVAVAGAVGCDPVVLLLDRAHLDAVQSDELAMVRRVGGAGRVPATRARGSARLLRSDPADLLEELRLSPVPKIRARAVRLAAAAAERARLPRAAVVGAAIGALASGASGAECAARFARFVDDFVR
jgi:transcriptional regulator with XRE-family HTH domain